MNGTYAVLTKVAGSVVATERADVKPIVLLTMAALVTAGCFSTHDDLQRLSTSDLQNGEHVDLALFELFAGEVHGLAATRNRGA